MAKFTASAAILFLIGLAIQIWSPQSIFGFLEEIGLAGLLVSAVYYLFRFFRGIKNRLLWKVRNKLIVSYAVVGLLPVLILAFIGWLSFRLIFGQVSALYLDNELTSITALVTDLNRNIRADFYQSGERTTRRLLELIEQGRRELIESDPGLAGLESTLFMKSRGHQGYRLRQSFAADTTPATVLPGWVAEGFRGLVHDRGKLYFRNVTRIETPFQGLILQHIPFDERLVSHIQRRTSITLTPPRSVDPDQRFGFEFGDVFKGEAGFSTINWMLFVAPIDWDTGSTMHFLDPDVSLFAIRVPIEKLYYDFYFSQKSDLGQLLLGVVAALGAVFIISELAALFIGFAIARTITRSVQALYAGTQHIQSGDFDYRIPSRGIDQLDTLASGFNQMSDSISGLLSQVSEKQRLEKEIEIAHEVQSQLFPQVLPAVDHFQLSGSCLPARSVSGDYYDFIPYGDQLVDVVIGDISGKGISAALLMASLQSAIRTQLIYQASRDWGDNVIGRAVGDLNEHLYSQTAADKFATLVFGRFDSKSLQLTYCNAGHNPPFWISNGQITKLGVGGMAAGLFEARTYEQETVQLKPGDMLVFYTDGVVEAEDPLDEQFGEERLCELIAQNAFLTADDVQALILDEVNHWSQDGDQRDDITVVVVKVDV